MAWPFVVIEEIVKLPSELPETQEEGVATDKVHQTDAPVVQASEEKPLPAECHYG